MSSRSSQRPRPGATLAPALLYRALALTAAPRFLDRTTPSWSCWRRKENPMGEIIYVTRARVVKEPGRGMKTAYLDAFPRHARPVRHPRRHQEILQDRAGGRTAGDAGPSRDGRGRLTDRQHGKRAGCARDQELSGQPGRPRRGHHRERRRRGAHHDHPRPLHLQDPQGKRAEAERALGVHEKGCPASQSVGRGINVEYSAEFEEVRRDDGGPSPHWQTSASSAGSRFEPSAG